MIEKLFDLSGRVALVTGGSRGLGKAMACALAQAGAEMVISSRHEAELQQSATEISGSNRRRVETVVADMADRAQVRYLAEEALRRMGRVDILINNAGMNIPQPIEAINDADWDVQLEVNLSSIMVLSRAIAPQMKQRGWGRIIHISSIMGLASKDQRNAYSATKSAVIGLARAMAQDLGGAGVTVNCLAPGPFLTDLPMSLLNDQQKQVFADRTALGRWGNPGELMGPVLLLASDAGSYITGTVLTVDGGVLCKTF